MEDSRVIRTRKALQGACMRLLSRKELNEITVTELCKAAGVDRKTFYHHYKTIADIPEEVERQVLSDIQKVFDQAAKPLDIPLLFKQLLQCLETGVLFPEVLLTKSAAEQFSLHLGLTMIDLLKDRFLAETKLDPVTFTVRARYITGGVIAVYLEWFRNGKTIPRDQLADRMGELVDRECRQLLVP